MDTRPLLTSAGHELFGALVAEGALQTLAIVEDFDVLEDRAFGLLARREPAAVDQFGLEPAPEALGHGVVVAVAPPAHAGHRAVRPQQTLVLIAGVLHGWWHKLTSQTR